MEENIKKFPPPERSIATEDLLNAEDQQKPTPEGAGKNNGFVVDPSKLTQPKPVVPLLTAGPFKGVSSGKPDDTNQFVGDSFLPGLHPRAENGDIIIEDMTKPRKCRWPFREGEHWDILRELGHGGYGTCYLCQEKEQGQLFCLKKVNIYSGQSTEDIEREARIMGSLKHENVVPFYGATIDYMCDGALHNEQRCCCLFMKYLSGGTLASCGRIGNTPLYNYTQQTLNGIEYCHRRGITHGDIKSNNILLDDMGRNTYITDFGMAQYKEDSKSGRLAFKNNCWGDVVGVGTVVRDILKVEPTDICTSTCQLLENRDADSQFIDIIRDINKKGGKRYPSSSLLERMNEIKKKLHF